jgi:hypothetical protein
MSFAALCCTTLACADEEKRLVEWERQLHGSCSVPLGLAALDAGKSAGGQQKGVCIRSLGSCILPLCFARLNMSLEGGYRGGQQALVPSKSLIADAPFLLVAEHGLWASLKRFHGRKSQ